MKKNSKKEFWSIMSKLLSLINCFLGGMTITVVTVVVVIYVSYPPVNPPDPCESPEGTEIPWQYGDKEVVNSPRKVVLPPINPGTDPSPDKNDPLSPYSPGSIPEERWLLHTPPNETRGQYPDSSTTFRKSRVQSLPVVVSTPVVALNERRPPFVPGQHSSPENPHESEDSSAPEVLPEDDRTLRVSELDDEALLRRANGYYDIACILFDLQDYLQSLMWYVDALDFFVELFGEGAPESIDTQNQIFKIYYLVQEIEESPDEHRNVFKRSR